MLSVNPMTDILDFIFKSASIFITAIGLLFGMYKFLIRSINKKFDEHREMMKIEINSILKHYETRLDYSQSDNAKLTNIVGVVVAENKNLCEDVATLKADWLFMQKTCEKNHHWDQITERRKLVREGE